MIPYYNRVFWLKNFNTWEIESFSEDDEKANEDYLKEKNENEFNIYVSVNTFLWNKRKNNELAEIKACFIDLDFPEIKSFWYDEEWIKRRANFLWNKYRTEIMGKLKEIEKLYDIKPSQVNVTYKWLHIFFEYSRDCYFITPKIHEIINNKLNEILWGDKNARDVARVYKLLWYIDWKEWKKWHIKPLPLSAPNNKYVLKYITKDVIENKFLQNFETRDEKVLNDLHKKLFDRIEKNIKKSWLIKTNISKINELDWFEFVEKLQNYFNAYKNNKNIFTKDELVKIENKIKFKDVSNGFYKFYEDDWKNLTSWLFLVKNDLWYSIQDYSQRTRQNNYNFIKNWVLRGIEYDYAFLTELIYCSTWITLNTNDDKKSVIDKKIFLDFLNSRLILPNMKLDHNVDENIKIINRFQYPESFWKIFIGFMHYLYKNIENLQYNENEKYYIIEVNKLLDDVFWIKTKSSLEHNKKTIFNIIEIISNIKIDMITKNVRIFRNIKKSKISNKDVLMVFPWDNNLKFKFSNPMFFNKNILTFQKWFKDVKITEFLLFINGFLEISKNNLTYKLKDIYKFLWYCTDNEKAKKLLLRKHINRAKKLWIIKSFKIENDNIIFSKYKLIK